MKRKFIIINILLLFIFPLNILAYSNKIILGGETIGIKVNSNGIYVVGFYEVNNKMIGKNAGFKVGDIIKKVNNIEVTKISDLDNIINSDNEYILEVKRNESIINLKLILEEENNLYKTGLFVKDTIYGSGTISYIDPETKIFGSLGHEITETSSLKKFEITTGEIYEAEVKSIEKSTNGKTGEKNTEINGDNVLGEIYKNELNGIFGTYISEIDESNLYEIAHSNEIRKGPAYIETVIDKTKKERFKINIETIDESSTVKNIKFTITDKKLLDKTGGIIQGMSGSPIIQNNKIIGAVNYVIINDTASGYGIFITTMLEEGDKLLEKE